MDKMIRGQRICKSLDTTDYRIALERFQAEVGGYAKQAANMAWDAHVRAMLSDETSWVHKTVRRIAIRSKATSRECTLTAGQLAGILLESEGSCMVTGLPFSDIRPEGARLAPLQASVDRIDSRQGYVVGNCRVVLLCVNLAMRDWGRRGGDASRQSHDPALPPA